MNNIKINPLTYYLLLIVFLCGYLKNALLIIFILLIHELGHIFFSKIFHYKIISITIYPFGGIIKYDKLINSPFISDFFTFSGGIIFQVILFLVLIPYNIFYLKEYNLYLLLFNLLPIIPLDGSILLNLILNKFMNYQKSYFYTGFISILTLLIFIIFNLQYSLNNYLIFILLITKLITYFKDYKYLHNRFLLEKYLYDFNYHKIKNTYFNDLSLLSKETFIYFYEDHKWVSEKQKLKIMFDKDANNW